MKILGVKANNHRRAFEVRTRKGIYLMPFARVAPRPGARNKVSLVSVDRELDREAFTYLLESGEEGTVHIDGVLDYNADPGYLADVLLYKLTLEAQRRIEQSRLARREIARRLGTSLAQLHRLLDQTNYRKSMKGLLSLLSVLDCDVLLTVRNRPEGRATRRLAG